jgi:hypothetical protein
VFRAGQAPCGFEPFVKRRCGQRSEQSKNRQARRPSANFLKRAIGDTSSVIVHAENERSDCVDVALCESLEYGSIFTGFVEAFVDVGKICGINRFHADEDPLPPDAAIRSTSSSSRKRLALICATQWTCALAAMMSRSRDFVR